MLSCSTQEDTTETMRERIAREEALRRELAEQKPNLSPETWHNAHLRDPLAFP